MYYICCHVLVTLNVNLLFSFFPLQQSCVYRGDLQAVIPRHLWPGGRRLCSPSSAASSLCTDVRNGRVCRQAGPDTCTATGDLAAGCVHRWEVEGHPSETFGCSYGAPSVLRSQREYNGFNVTCCLKIKIQHVLYNTEIYVCGQSMWPYNQGGLKVKGSKPEGLLYFR